MARGDHDEAVQAARLEASLLALDEGESEPLRDVAQRMIDDHEQLIELMQASGRGVSTTPVAKHQCELDELPKGDAIRLRRRVREGQVRAHDDAIEFFERFAVDARAEKRGHLIRMALPVPRKPRNLLVDIEPLH